ncbi:ABC transporter ATP-binding protein [Hyphobacterium sp. CCMP332]|nr:ABC transporter ATP-binding protein [Hyphobacterium sp. CCMP332]
MKTYFRLLGFAPSIKKYIPIYFLFSLLYIVFSQFNFILIMPLLDLLFGKVQSTPAELIEPGAFEFSIEYLKNSFNYYLKNIIIESGAFEALKVICLVVIAATFLSNVFRYLSQRLVETIRASIVRNIRERVYNHTISLNIGFFTNERKGDIISRITTDIQEIENRLTSTISVIIKDPLMLLGYFFILFSLSIKLTLFSLIIIPVMGGMIGVLVKQLKKDSQNTQNSLSRLISMMDETFSGLRVIKAFNATGFIKKNFKKENDYYAHKVRRMNVKKELASPTSEFLGVLLVSGILLIGGYFVLADQSSLSASEFIAYLAVFSQVMRPAKSITEAFSSVQRSLVAGDRVIELMEKKNPIVESDNPVFIKDFNDKIELKNINFYYGEKQVLKNINFEVKKGKMVALVGPSGGGKSTLADLIPRFADPKSGQILVDGYELKEIDIQSLRNLMGIVTQEAILFNDSIFNNISFGIEASEEAVIRAAKIANAHDFIMATEDGYNTTIGDRGMRLSGGQRQRISIARAVLKNPPILILDEATSALDTESERMVQEALNKLMMNRTSLVIAHRLSTIQEADEIIVLQEGEIIERGNHFDLIENKHGLYTRLKQMQSLN